MKYLASEIVKRAMDLADISNTDFLSIDEHIHYLNDSWKEFYQYLINKGDTQFVKEVYLAPGSGYGNSYIEYTLPYDLYQISSIVLRYTGEVIPRKVESESSNNRTYEIVNDKLRLYGVGNTDIVLRYYTTPEFITLPNKTITTDLTFAQQDGWDGANNNCVVTLGDVINLRTGEVIASNVEFQELIGGKVTSGREGNTINFMDFQGNSFASSDFSSSPSQGLKDSDNVAYYTANGKHFESFVGKLDLDLPDNFQVGVLLKDKKRVVYVGTDKHIYLKDGDTIIDTEETLNYNYFQIYDVIYNGSFGDVEFVSLKDKVVQIDSNDVVYIEDLPIKGEFKFNLQYGPVYFDGETKLASFLPDTEFNFPNELYIQVLSASLAIKYAMKQNASVEGLNNLYETYKTIFKNSLSQDSGYTRIINVYRA